MIRTIQFIAGILLLLVIEVLRVYYIMPFPGSQESDTIATAYYLHNNIFWIRSIGILLIIYPVIYFFMYGSKWSKIIVGGCVILYLYIFFLFNYRFQADKMFYQTRNKVFVDSASNKVSLKDLVIGVTLDGKSKAYPIEIIGYHHQVRDSIGQKPVMITYCTVCRTGRVYNPEVDGKPETFRLVGMDHFNAMFEDETTQSWWRQVNGEAIAGPLTGKQLAEIPSEQMTLKAWLEKYPQSLIMQPDSAYKEHYKSLEKFDEGKMESHLEKRDSLSWKEKSWIVGVQIGMKARAYDWNELLKQKVINDTLAGEPIAIALEPDSTSFHVWKTDTLQLAISEQKALKDKQTNSTWNWQGKATSGKLKDQQLPGIQAYQEFWHSWKTFHPQTTKYPQ